MISLYDTARASVVPLDLREEGKVAIYVCGPTVYGPPHIGHGRHTLVYDILRRFLTWTGLEVTFVSNITDIDDKIIDRANREGKDWREIATRCEAVWWEAMDRYDIARPDRTPHATEYVEPMVDLIAFLRDKGHAYVTGDGVYLRVSDVPDYGLLPRQSLEDLREGGGERSLVGTEKEHPADFVLWKFSKPGEPAWPSPWGAGRPGWHTECVVMSLDLLGDGFDLHTGGLDLVFPHHENERAQAVASGHTFARHWMHHGFLEIEGEKMSKSLGNVHNLLDLAERYEPRAFRLLVLQSHYRSPMEVTDTTLASAEAAVARLDALGRRVGAAIGDVEPDGDAMAEFESVMSRDLDTPGAVDVMFRAVRQANSALDQGETEAGISAAATAVTIARVLGLEVKRADEVPAGIARLVTRRTDARAAKDWATADRLRDELAAAGWTVEDGPGGPVARRLT